MYPYRILQNNIKGTAITVCNEISGEIPENSPREQMISAITNHRYYDSFLSHTIRSNEVDGIDFHISPKRGDMPVLVPRFVAGFKENFFSSRKPQLGEKFATVDFTHRAHWTIEDFNLIEDLNFTRDCAIDSAYKIMQDVMSRESRPVAMVSGPISTGGKGTREENLELFHQVIVELSLDDNFAVLNTMPFQNFFWKYRTQHEHAIVAGKNIIERFYFPLMKKVPIKKFVQIPGWETSTGALVEFHEAKKLHIETVPYVPTGLKPKHRLLNGVVATSTN